MRRIANWDSELFKWAALQLNKPIKWGATDCSTLVRDALKVIYELDLTEGIKWYRTPNGAMRTYITTGGIVPVLEKYGAYEIAPAFATSGDVLVIPHKKGEVADNAAIIVGTQFLNGEPKLEVVGLRDLAEIEEDYIILRLPNG